MKRNLKIGLFCIGLDTYWPQFRGLKPRLENYVRAVEKKLSRPGVEIVNLVLIDNPVKALAAGHQFRVGARAFVNDWNAHDPAHHCAVGVSHIAGKIDKLGKLLGIEVVKVC